MLVNAGAIPTGVYFDNTGFSENEVDITFLSDFTFNLTASYNFLENYRLGFKAFYFSDRGVPANYQTDVPVEVQNPDNANGFVKMDIFARAKIAEKFDIDFRVNNILNQQIYSPPYGGSDGYDIEWMGTVFSIGARYSF